MPFSNTDLNSNLFLKIFNSGMIGLFFTTFDGKVVEANQTFLNYIGYTPEDLKNNKIDWRKITPPEFQQVSDIAIKNLKTQGMSPPYEKEYYCKDGSRINLLMGSVAVPNAEHYQAMTYAIDITPRKQFEKELFHSKEQLEDNIRIRTKDLSEANAFLQSLIENIPNMIFVKDAETLKFVRFNKAGETLLGVSRSELIGKNDFDFFPENEAKFFMLKDKAVLSKKQILDIPEEPITTKNGVRILHTKKIPILSENNKPQYLLGISEDITDVKKAEAERLNLAREQVAREEAEKAIIRLELLGDASNRLASSIEYEKTIENFYDFLISRMADWCQIIIFPKDEKDKPQFVIESSKLSPDIAIHLKEYKWKLIKNIDEALSSNSNEKELLQSLKNFGFKSVINVQLRVRGASFGYVLLGTTKESSRYFNLADLQLAEELAEKAGLSIDNARLFSEAQKANQLKDEFLATLSHELRTPLNIIQGYSELLKNFPHKMSDQEKLDSVDAIHRNAIDQTNIVNDILDVSKIITGKMSINLSQLSPSDVIMSVVKNSERMAEVKNVQLTADISKDPILVMMDSTRLQQILWNLVSNAIKFTPSGGKIIIKNYFVDNNCIISVKDTGIGISPSFIPYIFERFRQEDGSMTRKYGGLGLGLAIVRHLVEMHGGTIEAHSLGKGHGSEFIVKIPITIANTQSKNTIPLKASSNSLKGTKILLIEDSRDNRLLITRLLANYGAEIQEADSAKMARTLLKKYQPDIILCDIGMPGEDGLEFIKSFRKIDSETPVIALTAYVRDEEINHFLDAGFQSHVAKPVSVQTLLSEIKKLI